MIIKTRQFRQLILLPKLRIAPMSNFRLDAKHLFLTYPQCDLDKQVAYDFLEDKFHPKLILVAREEHADGTPHLHVYLGLEKRRHFTGADFADIFIHPKTYHGNYQSCRSPSAAAKYAAKDQDFVSNFDPLKTNNRKLKEWASSELINGRRPLTSLVKDEPILLFGYQRLQQDYLCFLRDQQAANVLPLPPFLPNPWSLVLPSNRRAKRRHYWLWSSRPNVGKSFYFAKPLESEFGACIVSGDFSYWPIHAGLKCLILDEYNTALLKYSTINSMCDGTFGYRVFHGGVVKLDQPLIIILSNQPISILYPHMNELLYARFIEKKLD